MNNIGGLLITGLMGGGLFKAADSLYSAWVISKGAKAKKVIDEAKLPADVDSIVVQGAERAVLSLKAALEAADDRAVRQDQRIALLEKNAADDHDRIEALEGRLRQAEAQVTQAQTTIGSLRSELRQFADERDRRKP